jgi:hypothetical protein
MPQIQYACEDQNYVHIVSHVSHWPLYGDTETVICHGGLGVLLGVNMHRGVGTMDQRCAMRGGGRQLSGRLF